MLAAVKTDLRLQHEAEMRVASVLADFGSRGKIVEIYSLPTENRNHTLAIVENDRGDRLRVDAGEKLAVRGDIWTIERDSVGHNSCRDGTKLVLGKLIRKG